MSNAKISIDKTLKWEGGFILENVASDSGGETAAGISRTYNPQWRGWDILDANGGVFDNTVMDAVYEFYKTEFDALHLGEVVYQKIADQIYQAYTNCGSVAVQWAQHIVGAVEDRILGPMTAKALNEYPNEKAFLELYCNLQIAYYNAIVKNNNSQLKFLQGWIARATDFKE